MRFSEGNEICVLPADHAFAGAKGTVLGTTKDGAFVRCRLRGEEHISAVLIKPEALALDGGRDDHRFCECDLDPGEEEDAMNSCAACGGLLYA